MKLIRARHVATLCSPVIEDGAVLMMGFQILKVGRYRDFNLLKPTYNIDGVLMPGLINFHSHLELTNIPRPTSPASFVDWIMQISPLIRGDKATFAQRRADAVAQGIAQSLKFGVATVHDISQNVNIVRPVLERSGIDYISFGECLGLGERRARFDALLQDALSTEHSRSNMIGVSPHAPYTVDQECLRKLIAKSKAKSIPLSMHLAETPDEGAFLLDHSGPLAELYHRLDIDPGPAPGFAGGPIAWLHSLGAHHFQAAHVNYCSDADIQMLKKMDVSVVWCPRTHAYFGHPPHRWRDMIKAGIPVRIGTDSCASSPDLNIVDDLRLLYQQSPELTPHSLFDMAAGSLGTGAFADMVAFPTTGKDPLKQILQTPDMLPTHLWVSGKLLKS